MVPGRRQYVELENINSRVAYRQEILLHVSNVHILTASLFLGDVFVTSLKAKAVFARMECAAIRLAAPVPKGKIAPNVVKDAVAEYKLLPIGSSSATGRHLSVPGDWVMEERFVFLVHQGAEEARQFAHKVVIASMDVLPDSGKAFELVSEGWDSNNIVPSVSSENAMSMPLYALIVHKVREKCFKVSILTLIEARSSYSLFSIYSLHAS